MNRIRKGIVGAALAGTTAVGGFVGSGIFSAANAQTSDTTATTAPSSDSTTASTADTPHEANGITEAPLAGTDLDQATAAALAAVPGATVDRVETDADGASYEAHITKADGTEATVKMDSSFTVTSIEDGAK